MTEAERTDLLILFTEDADHEELSGPNALAILDHLERRGFVRRDGGVWSLTAAGRQVVDLH